MGRPDKAPRKGSGWRPRAARPALSVRPAPDAVEGEVVGVGLGSHMPGVGQLDSVAPAVLLGVGLRLLQGRELEYYLLHGVPRPGPAHQRIALLRRRLAFDHPF